ncbi:MAG: 30S ribosomal protein S3 [Deltaproteobacteria bacterium]|nr:30S ribosomal protein S3 [Deltaproteobacteria bacterium]
MGHKVNPTGFRLGIVTDWQSKWYADRDYQKLLAEDIRIRSYAKDKLYSAGISKVIIERAADKLKVNILTARPGIVIGKKGSGIEMLKSEIQKMTRSKEVLVNIQEVRRAELDAQLVAETVATQLERRVAYRRAMKRSITTAMKMGALGIKIRCCGRLGGAEMRRREWYGEGSLPLHTLRADVDYGFAMAKTIYGIIGVKAWIYKGEVLERTILRP